jgi:NAD(P)-dependent dehydrogenase (short-subunit alcohol dehydrogenase family)
VVATARQLSELEGLPSGSDLYRKALDPSRPATIQDTLVGCSDLRLVALINISEHGLSCPLESFLPAALRAELEVNVVGPQTLTQAFLPLLKKNAKGGEGRIIQVVSVLGRISIPQSGPYSATEHALVALAESLRLEVRPAIKVVLVEHGSLVHKPAACPPPESLGGPDLVMEFGMAGGEPIQASSGPQLDLSQDVELCGTQIVAALGARRPPHRIPVGPDAHWVARYQGLLPLRIWEWMLQRHFRRSGGS